MPNNATNLSAEVPPFVPRRGLSDEHGAPHSNNLPRYVTTCYPFVQEQQNRVYMSNSSDIQPLQVNLPWGPQNVFAPLVNPGVLAGRPSPHHGIAITEIQRNLADTVQGNAVHSATLQSPRHNNSLKHQNSQKNRSSSSKSESKQHKKVTKKNVGVQKEVVTSDSDDSELPAMVDTSQQTDFPSSIASKSLTDKPSPLKKVKNQHSKTRSSANDSAASSNEQADADVDSDSGYCSPKRRLKKHGGTNTEVPPSNNPGGSIPPLIFLDPRNVPPSLLYSSPSALPPNFLPHPSSPAPSSSNMQRYPPMDPPVLMGHPSPMINPPPITSRPPPGFPLPPGMLKAHEIMAFSETQLWNGPRYPSNFPPHDSLMRHQRHGAKPQGPNFTNHQKKQSKHYFAPTPNQNFPKKNVKREPRAADNRGATPPGAAHETGLPTKNVESSTLFLQDNSEFPGLGGDSFNRHQMFNAKLSYSRALTHPPPAKEPIKTTQQPPKSSEADKQKSRKRLKKAERASKAADEEYAEISREQEDIKRALKKTAVNRNRKQQPSLDLGEIFTKLEAKRSSKTAQNHPNKKSVHVGGGASKTATKGATKHKSKSSPGGANLLDASRPSVRRGKEREIPKVKKPSALKKVILKEREEKKEQRLQQLATLDRPDHDIPPFPTAILQSATSNEESVAPDLSRLTIDDVPPTVPQIHSRRYREYCCQVLDKKIDEVCTHILQKLVLFQERMYQRDPVKAKMRRRLVMGIREVTKHLKLRKLKCVIISPNLEKIQSKGGLDDALQQILDICEEQKVTYIFALGRKAMGRAVSKLVPVSIVGIFDYSGVDDHYKNLLSLVNDAQSEYKEMVSIYQQEVVKANLPTAAPSSGPSKRFGHMTHSRNPSAASCVSFASFISEPISELNEDSNWRVLMDAGEEPSLSPTAEADGDEDGELEDTAHEPEVEEASRKGSQSTVVECKVVQEQSEVALTPPQTPSPDPSESDDSSEYVDATSWTSRERQGDPEATEVDPSPDPTPHHSTDPQIFDESSTLPDVLEESTSEDRIQMWLEDSQTSLSKVKEQDNEE